MLSCHLSLQTDERYAQGGLLLDRLAALDVPHAVAAGDLNDGPAAAPSAGWRRRCRTAGPSRPGAASTPRRRSDPHQRIDAIFATEGVEVLGCGVPVGLAGVTETDLRAATDHLPVLAALRVPRSACA